MKPAQTLVAETERSGEAWKGLGLGASALGLACLGCCLAPILGIFLTAGTGAALAGFFRSWIALAILGSLALAVMIFLARKAWRTSCCPSPGSDCRNRRIATSETIAAIPSCRLSPETQAIRIGQLRSSLFRKIDSIDEGKDGLKLQFEDKPETVQELTDFIRFERECCTSLQLGLEWKPNGGLVALEIRGPAPMLKAMKEVAGTSVGRP